MVGKVEIIVAGEREQAAAVALDPWAFPAKTLGKRAPQGGAIELLQFANSEIIQGPHAPRALHEAGAGAAQARSDRMPGRGAATAPGRQFCGGTMAGGRFHRW